MAEINFIDKLKKGEKIECKSCHKGYYVPYNTSADKAHSFCCSNPECNAFVHWDPVINIE